MSLYDINTWQPITKVPFQREYKVWKGKLTPAEIQGVIDEINRVVDEVVASGTDVVTTSWVPGSDWTGTPYQPLYATACGCDPVAAAQFYGLVFWESMMTRPEEWSSDHYEMNGIPIKGRTYFRISRP